MKNVILISEAGSIDSIASALSMSHDVGFINGSSGLYVRSNIGEYEIVSVYRESGLQYDGAEAELIDARFSNAEFYSVPYRDIESIKDILLSLAARNDLLIDNDHGYIAEVAAFCDRWARDPIWDWTRME